MTAQKKYIVLAIALLSFFGVKALASLTLNATTVAGSGDVVISAAGTTTTTFSIPTGAIATSNFLNITGTLPSSTSASTNGLMFAITSAGASSQIQRGGQVTLAAGYTGSSATTGFLALNTVAGTSTTGWTAIGGGNVALVGNASVTATAGHVVGVSTQGSGSSVLNLGGRFAAITSTNSPALNVGAGALALNATVNVAGFFGLMNTAPTLASSAALIADNGGTGSNIFVARSNGTALLTVSPTAVTSTVPIVAPGQSWTVDQWGGTASVSASTSEEVLRTILIPANTLGTNGRLIVDTTWFMTGSTNAKTPRVRVGAQGSGLAGTVIQAPSIATGTTISARQNFGLQAIDATNQVGLNGTGPSGGFGNVSDTVATTLDSTQIIEINITGQKASAGETLSLRAVRVEVTKP